MHSFMHWNDFIKSGVKLWTLSFPENIFNFASISDIKRLFSQELQNLWILME